MPVAEKSTHVNTRLLEWMKLSQLSPSEFEDQSPFARYASYGLSCVPIATDGSKRPLTSWKPYQEQLPNRTDVLKWYKDFGPYVGIAVITGKVSLGLEVLDFDDGQLFAPWREMVESIVCRLPVIATPSSGWHVYYRCEAVCNSQKIAMDPAREKSTLIETRGEGGYVLTVGCPPECHSTGNSYIQESGPALPEVPFISLDERKELWVAARSFDRRPPHHDKVQHRMKQLRRETRTIKPLPIDSEITPWDDFDQRGVWAEILEPVGWSSTDGIHWRRPGKVEGGQSAKVNIAQNGQEVLTVFSSNAGPLSPTDGEKSWGKNDAYALLHHGGNRSESAKALREMGYGGRAR